MSARQPPVREYAPGRAPSQPHGGDVLDATFSRGAGAGIGAASPTMMARVAPDGSHLLSSTAAIRTADACAGRRDEEAGTCEPEGNLRTLAANGGAPRSLTLFPYDDGTPGAQPRSTVFGGGMLARAN